MWVVLIITSLPPLWPMIKPLIQPMLKQKLGSYQTPHQSQFNKISTPQGVRIRGESLDGMQSSPDNKGLAVAHGVPVSPRSAKSPFEDDDNSADDGIEMHQRV